MKILLLNVMIISLLVSCKTEESIQYDPYKSDLSTFEGTNSLSAVQATLANSEGKVITDLADLMPNTEYKITLNSKDAEFIRIKKGDGYQLLNGPSLDSHYYGKSEYSLVTSSDFTDQIYINVVALHRKNSEYVRERSQIFLLPQQ